MINNRVYQGTAPSFILYFYPIYLKRSDLKQSVFYSSWENEHIFVQPPICMQINVKNPNGMKYWRIYPGGEVGRNLSPRLRPCVITLSCAFLMLSSSWSRLANFQPRLLSLGNSSLLKIQDIITSLTQVILSLDVHYSQFCMFVKTLGKGRTQTFFFSK